MEDEDLIPEKLVKAKESISITKDDLMEMHKTGNYDVNIVKSVNSKRRGGSIITTFTLVNGDVVKI